MTVEVIVHPDPEALAASVAARLITAIIDAQAAHGNAGIVLTGGGMGTKSQQAVVADPAGNAVDWAEVDFYWGDERFVAATDPDRNEKQAYDAMLDALPIDAARVHAMPATGGSWGDDPVAAAAAHAADLAAIAAAQGISGLAVPRFDVLMLGVGPDAHIASLFPDHGDTGISDRTIIPVTNSPKPPPTRLSFTFPVICSAVRGVAGRGGSREGRGPGRGAVPRRRPQSLPRSRRLRPAPHPGTDRCRGRLGAARRDAAPLLTSSRPTEHDRPSTTARIHCAAPRRSGQCGTCPNSLLLSPCPQHC